MNPSDIYAETRFVRFSVTYFDDRELNAATISDANFDIFVQPSAYAVGDFARVVSISPSANASMITAIYEVDLLVTWGASTNGVVFSIDLNGGAIRDSAGNSNAGQALGTFTVKVGRALDKNAPNVAIHTSEISLPGNQKHWMPVVFTDDASVDVSTITADGDWNDPREQVFQSVEIDAGANFLSFAVPEDAVPGFTGVRMRLSSMGGMSATGEAADGEVEDYFFEMLNGDSKSRVEIRQPVSGTAEVIQIEGFTSFVVAVVENHDVFLATADKVQQIDFYGTRGDDILKVDLPTSLDQILRFSGGAGQDTLRLLEGVFLDLTASTEAVMSDVETIDLSDNGVSHLTLDPASIQRNATASQTIVIRTDAFDRVAFGEGWKATKPAFFLGEYGHSFTSTMQSVGLHVVNDRAWQNPYHALDVSGDQNIMPNDALIVLNSLNRGGFRTLLTPSSPAELPAYYYDSSGDNQLSPIDALKILNYINRQVLRSGKEGESGFGVATGASKHVWIDQRESVSNLHTHQTLAAEHVRPWFGFGSSQSTPFELEDKNDLTERDVLFAFYAVNKAKIADRGYLGTLDFLAPFEADVSIDSGLRTDDF